MSSKKLKTALLHCGDTLNSYYYDWQQAFITSDLYECDNYNLYRLDNVGILKSKIKSYDLIVALHSSNASGVNFKFNFPYIPALQKRRGKMVMFFGNEVNIAGLGERLHDRLKLIDHLKPEYIASQLPIETAKALYSEYDSQILEVTHALNPDVFKPLLSQSERKIDFGIRTGKYPSYLGDDDRNRVLDFFRANASKYNLNVDINSDYRQKLNPSQWADFLNSCRGTIGNESGGYFLEKDDRTVMEVRKYIFEKLSLSDPLVIRLLIQFFSVYHSSLNYKYLLKAEHYLRKILPKSLNDRYYSNNSTALINYEFEEIYNKFYKNYKQPLNGRAISSRHFDAIGTKTCQVMMTGHFNGILKGDEHYISINRDFSNIEDVMQRFKDLDYRTNMVNHTYDYVMNNHTLSHRVNYLYNVITGSN